MKKSDAELRKEVAQMVKKLDGDRLEKLHIFAEGLFAGRQRDGPEASKENGDRKGV
jgi:hypothetical protein